MSRLIAFSVGCLFLLHGCKQGIAPLQPEKEPATVIVSLTWDTDPVGIDSVKVTITGSDLEPVVTMSDGSDDITVTDNRTVGEGRTISARAFYLGQPDYEGYESNVDLTSGDTTRTDLLMKRANLVLNGSFEQGGFRFWGQEDHFAQCLFSIDTAAMDGRYSARMSIGDTAEYWRVAVNSIVPVEQAKKYSLTFYAKASASRTLVIHLMKDAFPYDGYGLFVQPSLGVLWTRYEYSFTSTATDSARLGFCVGHDTGSVWIDRIVLQEVE